jgi:predicted dehydrogenase
VSPIPAIAVIGAGHLGSLHAQALHRLDPHAPRWVIDLIPERAARVAEPLGARVATDASAVWGEAGAVIVATPTETHFAIAQAALTAGCHVFVEKPITRTPAEGAALVALAAERGRVLQVGHIERFNPIFQALHAEIGIPAFVEAERLAPFVPRSLDVDIVLDLMIHDLDLLLSVVPAPLESVDAVGVAVLTPREDIATARLRFANGTVANLTASRVSQEKVRKIRFFSRRGYHSLDLLARSARKVAIRPDPSGPLEVPGVGRFAATEERLERREPDPLSEELRCFLEAAAGQRRPLVSGEQGLRVLEVATEIGSHVQQSLRRFREAEDAGHADPDCRR